jgi:hypothetical protein
MKGISQDASCRFYKILLFDWQSVVDEFKEYDEL